MAQILSYALSTTGGQEILEHALTTHPVGAELLDRVRPRAVEEHSGKRLKRGASEPGSAKKTGAR